MRTCLISASFYLVLHYLMQYHIYDVPKVCGHVPCMIMIMGYNISLVFILNSNYKSNEAYMIMYMYNSFKVQSIYQ